MNEGGGIKLDSFGQADINQQEDALAYVERAIVLNIDEITVARTELRKWLFSQTKTEVQGNSIGDALQEISSSSVKDNVIGVVLIRCLSVEKLLPETNSANQLTRLIVEICEKTNLNLCAFIGLKQGS